MLGEITDEIRKWWTIDFAYEKAHQDKTMPQWAHIVRDQLAAKIQVQNRYDGIESLEADCLVEAERLLTIATY